MSNESKQLFRNHLENKNIMSHNQSMLYPSAYIEFKAALDAKKPEEIPRLTYKYMHLLNSDAPEMITYGFSEFTQKKLQTMN